jgi:NAD(P)-dependent dehydrogenase (short-subunit alcohol dehydrogenase family)
MNAKIMIVGLGDLGSVFLDLLLRMRESVEVVVATRNLERAALRCNMAQLAALAQGSASRVRLVRLDLDDVATTARTIAEERPEILLSTATMATWWLPDLLPAEDARSIRRAGFGVWMPVHLAPTLRLMRAVREARFEGFVLTAPYPDVVNPVLGKVGLAPTTGVGNVAEIVPKLVRRAAIALQCRPEHVRVSLVAHHALVSYAYRGVPQQPGVPVPPFILRVEKEGCDVSGELDLLSLMLAPEPITEGRATHLLTASTAIPLIRALMQEEPVQLHAPAPGGLPGGYPITAHRAGVEPALDGIPMADAVTANTAAQKFDGVDRILDDGTVVLDPEGVLQLQSVLGSCAGRISISDVEEQATDLVRRYQAFAKKRGVGIA